MKPCGWITMVLLCIFLITSCEKVEQADNTTPESQRFVGTWKFLSLTGKSNQGDYFAPYGENLFGRLMYDAGGNMSFFAMQPGRPRFASGDMLRGTPEEIKEAFEKMDAYCGMYKVDPINKTVTHLIEGSRFPNWEGGEQVRHYKFTHDTLTLSARLILSNKEWLLKAELIKL